MSDFLNNYNRRDAIKRIAILTVGAGTVMCSLASGDNSSLFLKDEIKKSNDKILPSNRNSNTENGNNALFYFSGTGNSLKVALDIAQALPNCEIIPISKYHLKSIKIKYDRIGIVCPVYAFGPPVIVMEFIKNLTLCHRYTYLFCVITYRNDAGATLRLIANNLEKRELELQAGFAVEMPGNHIAYYDADSVELQNQKFNNWNKQLKDIRTIITEKKEFHDDDLSMVDKVIKSAFLYSLASRRFRKGDKKFHINDNCNGCKICAKVCPVNNIYIFNNKPVWKNDCEQCLACLNWCPKASIDFDKKTIGKERYHHPDISLKEMILKV